MNATLVTSIETLAKKAANEINACNAQYFAQAAAQMHYAENPPPVPAVPEGGTD